MRKLTHSEIEADRKKPDEINNYSRNPIFVLCDNIRSIFNVGAIFRTSDAAFIEKLFLTGYTPYPPRNEIEKVALGATGTVPWEYYKDPMEIIMKLKKNNIKIAVLEITDQKNLIWNVKADQFPVCLVLGNEINGVSKEIIDLADLSFEIPMLGMKQSLNVSVAYGIAVYAMVRELKYNDIAL
ncbi:MAG TPA: TrmH family RNA methyltransferase [Ignavibacteria bacterium]|nr:RNA methyltransferase [Bacteroidota bacterium]HRI84600.1 TrmH family RNA methyltransferase [Ignavibacteria bacterium]HRJ98323.1 TrmH family RNA methyltransferase [Ignavibacteria bacterium]